MRAAAPGATCHRRAWRAWCTWRPNDRIAHLTDVAGRALIPAGLCAVAMPSMQSLLHLSDIALPNPSATVASVPLQRPMRSLVARATVRSESDCVRSLPKPLAR